MPGLLITAKSDARAKNHSSQSFAGFARSCFRPSSREHFMCGRAYPSRTITARRVLAQVCPYRQDNHRPIVLAQACLYRQENHPSVRTQALARKACLRDEILAPSRPCRARRLGYGWPSTWTHAPRHPLNMPQHALSGTTGHR